MRKVVMMSFIISAIISILSGASFAAESAPTQGLDHVERQIYGAPGTGGLLLRLSKVERDLFGMELPGSLTERQQALQLFVEEGNASQPSLLFKMSVAEWITMKEVHSRLPFADRVSQLEATLEGESKVGALSARLESLLTKLLPGGVQVTQVVIPGSTVFKANFAETVTVRNVAVGDVISLVLDEDCIINGVLAVAKGSRLFAEVTKVQMPRSFGRPSELSFAFQSIETLGGPTIPVEIGSESEKAMEMDSGAIGAIGASLGGAIALGPLGLAGGFLVRGNDKQIPEGASVYVQTSDAASVGGYTAPDIMKTVGGGAEAPAQSDVSYQQEEPAADSDPTVY